ncbi:Rhodanese-like domain-containing protein [Aspergillus pseudoustus]|uniref:Rhodanese-like domain-containing protein n=1 Tax=Aspergillus pseudoustus TaxID=1810923 RepID=A0ABR4K713_9EURO
MASLTCLRGRRTEVASLLSRTTKYTLTRDYTSTQNLLPTRRFGSACLTRRANNSGISSHPRTTSCRILAAQPFQYPSTPIRRNSGKTPTFRQWGFEDINAALPSSADTPPSTPQKNLILIDVREPAELSSTGIIPTAVAVPLASQPDALFLSPDEFETRFGYPKPGAAEEEQDIVFYCKAGVRARAAAQLAVQAGYDAERVGVYDGSWLDWAANGGRVERWEGDD